MYKTLKVSHRSGIDDLVKIVSHSNSVSCPSGMLELNPAFGCDFQCAYCGIYALEEEFYNEVIVYDDFPEYLDKYLTSSSAASTNYFYFSAKTDCFQAPLIESGITLRTLQVLRKHNAPYFIVTKSGLPPDDILELLVASRDINQLIISATMPNERMREILEPGAPTLKERLDLAEFGFRNDIVTTASLCPILPISNRQYMNETIRQFSEAGLRHFYMDFARLSKAGIRNILNLLPEHREEFERHYFTPDAVITPWRLSYRGIEISKYQPPLSVMLEAFENMANMIREVEPTATVSLCNHFATPETLRGFNRDAQAKGISCIGHRFCSNTGCAGSTD